MGSSGEPHNTVWREIVLSRTQPGCAGFGAGAGVVSEPTSGTWGFEGSEPAQCS
jgi:hypothetical protein